MPSTALARRPLSPAAPKPPLGWPLLPATEAGGLSYPTLDESVRQTIRIILLTRPGELLLHPSFGAGLEDLLHEPNTVTTRRRIRDRIRDSLVRWEPRIVLDAVEVWPLDDKPDTLRAEILYRLKRTGQGTNLVLDLSLGS